jgi:Protein of unknown function (DUF3631)
MSARDFYSDLGVALPGGPETGSVSVRCFANVSAHKRDDHNPSCSVNIDTGQWKCFACGAKGGAFDAAVAFGWSRSDAADLAKRHDVFADDRARQGPTRPSSPNPGGAAPKLPTETQVAAWHEALVSDARAVEWLFELRGWTPEVIKSLELGIDGERITIPIRDAERRLVGSHWYAPNPAGRNGNKMLAAKGVPRALFPPPEPLPADARVYLVEGEPDAIAMWSLELCAVAVPGAQAWRAEWAPRFAGRDIVLIPDLDAEGRGLMAQAARDLTPHAKSVRIVDLDPSRDDKGDVGDLVRDAAQDGRSGLAQARALIERAANDASVIQPLSVEHTGPLLDAVRAFVRRYVVLSEAQSCAVALWVLHTHAIEAAQSTPYLSVTSAEKESGKTRLLETLELVAMRPWFTGRTTPAALARKTDTDGPTLLLDESDATFNGDREYAETLRGVLNTGYRRGGKTTVCVGQGADITTRDLSTFGAKAIAGIGELPDTVASRSIPIRLKRRGPDETVERFKRKTADAHAAELRERLGVWAAQHEKALGDADPGSLAELGDRADEVWEPLRAIADLAGLDWAGKARAAAIELSGRHDGDDAPSNGVLALSAIRHAMGDRSRVATAELLETLNADDELPFGGFRKGNGLDARGLARLMRPYGIKSGSVRVGDATPKGYSRSAFEDAWARYAPPSPESPPHPPHPPQATSPPPEKPREYRDVADVADVADTQGMGDRERQYDRHSRLAAPTAPLAEAAIVARINHESGAIELTNGCATRATDCANPIVHAGHHTAHPDSGRIICVLCHPPAAMFVSNGSRP